MLRSFQYDALRKSHAIVDSPVASVSEGYSNRITIASQCCRTATLAPTEFDLKRRWLLVSFFVAVFWLCFNSLTFAQDDSAKEESEIRIASRPRVEAKDPRFAAGFPELNSARAPSTGNSSSPEALAISQSTAESASDNSSRSIAEKPSDTGMLSLNGPRAEERLAPPAAHVSSRSKPESANASSSDGSVASRPAVVTVTTANPIYLAAKPRFAQEEQIPPRKLDPGLIQQGKPIADAPQRIDVAQRLRQEATSGEGDEQRDEDEKIGKQQSVDTNRAAFDEPSPEVIKLGQSISQTLKHYQAIPEDVSRRSPWGVMHSMLAFEIDSQVWVRGKKMNALGWLCWNGTCANQQLLGVQQGGLVARQGPGLQGHEGQFLAMLAQCGVLVENELRVGNKTFTVEDLVRFEQWNCEPGTELTFKLIGLSYYLDTDATWKSRHGDEWSLERLIQEELKQPVVGAACGGTHRMMGYSFALRQRELEEKPIEGQWLRAKVFVDDFVKYSLSLQNPDGSFSTAWFRGREAQADIERRMQTTGHILEWLVYTLPDERLDEPGVTKAVTYLNNLMWEGRGNRWEVGPRGHALHALLLYHRRRFGKTGLEDKSASHTAAVDQR